MKTVSTLRPREKEISVFLIEEDDVKKIGEVDRVSVFDHAGHKLIDNLYNDFPEASFYENLLANHQIPPDAELRLGMFFEVLDYSERNVTIHYFWYFKAKEKKIFLLTSKKEAIQKVVKERRLFHSGMDLLRMRIKEKIIEKNINIFFDIERICDECGKPFRVDKYARERQRFCGAQCRRKNFYRTQKR
jgi:hypothetical protein